MTVALRVRNDTPARSARVLQSGGDPVDGQLDQTAVSLAIRVVRWQRPEPRQEAYLDMGQRVDVRASQPNRSLDRDFPLEEFTPAGDSSDGLDRQPVFIEDSLPERLPFRSGERRVQARDLRFGAIQDQLRVV